MARQNKPIHPAFFFVISLAVIGAGIAFMFIPDEGIYPSPSVIFGIVIIVAGAFMLIPGFLQIGRSKKAKAALKDATTLAGKTYGGLGAFKRYTVILDKDGQKEGNVAKNVVGIASLIFLGVGFVSAGVASIDCFISSSEIVLNNISKNLNYEEALFYRIPANTIKEISFDIRNKSVRVFISLNSAKQLVLDINTRNENAEEIRNTFMSLDITPYVPQKEETEVDEPNTINVFE